LGEGYQNATIIRHNHGCLDRSQPAPSGFMARHLCRCTFQELQHK